MEHFKSKLQKADAYSENGYITITLLSTDPFQESIFIESLNPIANSPIGKAYHEQYNKQP